MRRRRATSTLTALLAVTGLLLPAGGAAASDSADIVVANRGSSSVSIIDTGSLDVSTVGLPGSEPMYVSHSNRHDRVFVGDRANDQVIVLDEDDYSVEGTVTVGAGVFHQWVDGGRLWVVGDTSDTVTVVDAESLEVITTIGIPADIIADGGSPHDVVVSGRHAFVSIVGLPEGGMVLRYSTLSFEEAGRIASGGDPHLFARSGRLYVASQDGSSVTAYNPLSLRELSSIEVPAAHGIWVTKRGDVFVTNIAGGGESAVFSLDRRLRGIHETADTEFATPHNLAVDERDRRLFVTHSGATADRVTVVDLRGGDFGAVTDVRVGVNPFGLALVD